MFSNYFTLLFFLGAFAKLRKSTISSACLSVYLSDRLSVRVEKLNLNWADSHDILYLNIYIFLICRENSSFIQV